MDVDSGKKIHFEVVDYRGRKIVCTEREWKHVCKKPHEYMEGEEQEVIEALKKPDHGLRHIDDENPEYRRIYYMSHLPKECYVKVIVEFRDKGCQSSGEIVTAYETNNIREKLEWPK